MKLPVAAFLAFALSAGLVHAEPVRQGDLEIDAAWARASIGTSRPGAAYFTVRNLGDEADRLTIKSLEHLRDMADRHGFGLILMGMPGLEKRLARYAQLYSRIGFVHEFKPLTETEMRLLLATHAGDFGISFDPAQLDAIEAQAAVIRITRGNFRLMERLFAQMRRIMTLNRVEEVTADIVQAARDCLVIGPGN